MTRTGNGDATLRPAASASVYNLLYSIDLGSDDLDGALARLEKRDGAEVYAELLHLLCHLQFKPAEAKRHWKRVIEHRETMQSRLQQPIDLRIALVSYFVQVNRRLTNPKIIELKLYEQTRASVYRDELTGLFNYRYLRECLPQEIARADRDNAPLSLVMLDVDDFKVYNDTNGHHAANETLAKIADVLRKSMRRLDVAVRYGGEEFALILPGTPKKGARLVAERTRRAIETHAFPNAEAQPTGRLTVSLGIATAPGDASDASELVKRADTAMYVAKAQGKNQVQLFGSSTRSYHRCPAALDGRFRILDNRYHDLTTVNISEGGLLLVADHELPMGTLVDLNLTLPAPQKEIAVSGRVVHVMPRGDGKYEAAVRIVDIGPRDMLTLASFLRRGTGLRTVPVTARV
jgi:diguanylate cyclase (GGDEF)-like protein